jgi:lipase
VQRLFSGLAAELPYGEWAGAEPTIVLVPGIFASHRALSALARELAPARRVVAFDLRGRGRAPLDGPFGITRHADDL